MFMLIIAALASLFKFATDKILANRPIKPAVMRHLTSILLFASFFLAIFVFVAIVNGPAPDMSTDIVIVLVLVGLGTIIKLLSLMFGKLLLKEVR
jgi:hypothetical protein